MTHTTRHARLAVLWALVILALLAPQGSLRAQSTPESDIAQVRQAIANQNLSWTPRESRISRLPLDQKVRLLGEEPYSPYLPDLRAFEPTARVKAEPTRLDWRNHNGNWVTPVRDQGDCGSCWAFAATAVFESAFIRQQNTPGVNFDRAEQMVLSCSGAGTCEGGYSVYALQYISNTGVSDESCFPYVASDVACGNRCADWSSRAFRGRGVLGVANSVSDIRAALQNGPVTISYDVYLDFYLYGSGVYEYSWGFYVGGHAVTLVGYDNVLQAWLCKNSWGDDFGEDGYFWIRWGSAGVGRSVYILDNNRPPQFNAFPDKVGTIGQPLTFTVPVYDPNGDALTHSMNSTPALSGASLHPGTGAFSWTPPPGSGGVYSVTFTAQDSWNPPLSSSRTITLAVCPESCEDGSPCTADSCNPQTGLCDHVSILQGEPCTTGLFCLQGQVCNNGICGGGYNRSCAHLTDSCNVGVCDENAKSCVADPTSHEGLVCDDGEACTANDRCVNGVCTGTSAVNCDHLTDACNIGMCDLETGGCYKNPLPLEGHACDDGKWCTLGDVCTGGVCAGNTPRDCGHVADACNVAVCNEAFDRCDADPAPRNNHPCDDGFWCTVDEICQNGICGNSRPRNCSAFTDQCAVGTCDEINQRCYADPTSRNGLLCNDGRFCTENEICQNGVCTGGDIRACSSHTNQCNIGVCNLALDACVADPGPKQNDPCQDGFYCTVDDTCQQGVCVGGPARDCSHVSDGCNDGVCNEAQDICQKQQVTNNTPCTTGLYCKVGELCQNGACLGGHTRDCSHLSNTCNLGACSEAQQTCIPLFAMYEGNPCEDDSFCTFQDTCRSGQCVGGPPRNCSGALTTPACQTASCNNELSRCEALAANEGLECDDSLFCTVNTTCQAGNCLGEARDCSGEMTEPQCQTAWCEELGARCRTASANQGQDCATGDYCLVGERCQSGVCAGGQARDCSGEMAEPQCQQALCNTAESRCDVLSAREGLACTNGLFCIVEELCEGGRCVGGSLRDCSEAVWDAQCQAPFCDAVAGACAPEPINEGLACLDDNLCTRDDRCQEGICLGDLDPCDDEVACTTDACDPQTGDCGHTPNHSLCDDGNDCTTDTCDPDAGCLHAEKPDWTFCRVGQGVVRACLENVCTDIRSNDLCVGAFPMILDGASSGNLRFYHPYFPVGEPCVEDAFAGPDAFYSYRTESDEPLDLVLEYDEGLDVRVVIWDDCGAEAVCGGVLYSDPETWRVFMPLDPVETGTLRIFQVIAPALEASLDARFVLSVRTEGWENEDGDEDGDADGDTDEPDGDIDPDPVDGDVPDGDVPDGDRDVEEGCTPSDRVCAGWLVLECSPGGRGWVVIDECASHEVCEDGYCLRQTDGDSDTTPQPDGDVPDGDRETERPPATDGDDVEPADGDEAGGGSGGCRQVSGWPVGLLVLLGAALRRRGRRVEESGAF